MGILDWNQLRKAGARLGADKDDIWNWLVLGLLHWLTVRLTPSSMLAAGLRPHFDREIWSTIMGCASKLRPISKKDEARV